MAQREPRRAWKWLSHSGRPSCSKKLPPEKGAKHSCGRTRGEVSPHTHTPDTTITSPVQPPVALAEQHQTSPTNLPHPHLGNHPSQVLPPIAAHSADEAVRVPECPECGDVVIQNGALAALATWGEQLQEVPAAVGAALALMETWDRNHGGRRKPMCSRSGVLHHLRPEARGWAGRGWWCTTKRGLEGTGLWG